MDRWPAGRAAGDDGDTVNDTDTEDCAAAVGPTVDGALMTFNVTTGAALELVAVGVVLRARHRRVFDSTLTTSPGAPGASTSAMPRPRPLA